MLNFSPISEFDQLFWTVFRTSKNLIAITDSNNRTHLAVNDAWTSTLKFSAEEVIGKTGIELNIWPDDTYPNEINHRLKADVPIENMPVIMRAKNGVFRHCLLTVREVIVSDQKIYVFSSDDITRTKLADEAVTSSREMLIDALESINEGFVLYGADGGLIVCNSKFKEFYGYSDEEAAFGAHRKYLGRLDIERKTVFVDETKAEKYINRRENHHASPPKSFEVKLKDGRILMLSDRKTSSGGVVSIQSDITSQRKIEEALRRSQKMDAIGQLTGGIAHDFNNILSIIMGNLELIEDVIGNDEDTKSLTTAALRGAHRGAEITKKLLNFSRMSPSTTTRSSVNNLLENMEHLISKSLTASIQVNFRLSDELWDVDIDPGDFEDAILNLALNAKDALPGEGALTIETTNTLLDKGLAPTTQATEDQEFVLISIRDSGTGMSEEVREKIFEPFFTTKDQGKGTGLGLSMVYSFVQRSDGHITVQSEPEKGTTVNIYLPRTLTTERIEPAREEPQLLYEGTETILVVDDEVALVNIAASLLAKLGYKVITASSSAVALELIHGTQEIDLLFSDVIMPGGIDGYQLAQKALELRPDLKILMASGYTMRHGILGAPESQFVKELSDDLLQKPYSRAQLTQKIRSLLDS